MRKSILFLALVSIVFAECHRATYCWDPGKNVRRSRAKFGGGTGSGSGSAQGNGTISYANESTKDIKMNVTLSDSDSIQHNTEEYSLIQENQFLKSLDEPLSTFSIDVDNASYSNMRRYINSEQRPPRDAIRLEEMINYFDYDYSQPQDGKPFALNTELAVCPWNSEHQIVSIALQGKEIETTNLPPSNFVFLIDASGSMADENKLPLVKDGLKMLTNALGEQDRVALITYAGEAGVALNSTSCNDKDKIIKAINRLESGGSTQGSAGIQKAYEIAKENFIPGGNNRIILCTDGDFNVGTTSESDLVHLIEEKRKSDIFLTVCGFGEGNYKDNKMEKLADNGNGFYHYIDRYEEAHKVFVQGLRSTLFTIAKDVKIQVEFNPLYVESYRLIGYENRVLENQDFENDSIDAGEIGAGHTITALYEIIPSNGQTSTSNLKYQQPALSLAAFQSGEIMTVSLRYKLPESDTSELISCPILLNTLSSKCSENLSWACSVAAFGMVLRDSKFKGMADLAQIKTWASSNGSAGSDKYKKEFLELIEKTDKILTSSK